MYLGRKVNAYGFILCTCGGCNVFVPGSIGTFCTWERTYSNGISNSKGLVGKQI